MIITQLTKNVLGVTFSFLESNPVDLVNVAKSCKILNGKIEQYLAEKIDSSEVQKTRAKQALENLFIEFNTETYIQRAVATITLPVSLKTCSGIGFSFNQVLRLITKKEIAVEASLLKYLKEINLIPQIFTENRGWKKLSKYRYGPQVIKLLFFIIAYTRHTETRIEASKMLSIHVQAYQKFNEESNEEGIKLFLYFSKLSQALLKKEGISEPDD